MLDPDTVHQRVTRGEPAALRSTAAGLRQGTQLIRAASVSIDSAGQVSGWSGLAASTHDVSVEGLARGADTARNLLTHLAGAVDAAAGSLERTIEQADAAVVPWRNRAPDLPEVVEQLLAYVVTVHLGQIGASHAEQLAAIDAVLSGDGDELDLDALDDETREWVEHGLDRTDEWLEENGSSLGPLIPNTAATGDDRKWIPQGLGFSDESGLYFQSYYTKDGGSFVALIDEGSGAEANELALGDEDGNAPGHVGGVTVDDENGLVYVSSGNKVYTYRLDDLRHASPGTQVDAVATSPVPKGASSYTAIDGDTLYVGSHEDDVMYVYERAEDGETWVPKLDEDGEKVAIDTPDNVQGVVVRDDEFVFSTSSGRQNESALVVQDRESGEQSEPYVLPTMSQNIVEVDGTIVTTYESGAEHFDSAGTGGAGWLWGVPDDDGLWANPHMTVTPLSELGLGPDEVEVEPQSLQTAAGELGEAESRLREAVGRVADARTTPGQLGDVPPAATTSAAINAGVERMVELLRSGARTTRQVGEAVEAAAGDLAATDGAVAGFLSGMTPE